MDFTCFSDTVYNSVLEYIFTKVLLKGYQVVSLPSRARFPKVPDAFRSRKAICEPANRFLRKADLLTCFQANCMTESLSTSFLCGTRKWPVKFRAFSSINGPEARITRGMVSCKQRIYRVVLTRLRATVPSSLTSEVV